MAENKVTTQVITLHAKLMRTNFTYGSGGWQIEEWMAFAYAPGKIISLNGASVVFSDPMYLHWLSDPKNMVEISQFYFGIDAPVNPFVKDNFVLIMVTKNGGAHLVNVDIPCVCEVQPHTGRAIKFLNES